MMRNCAVSGSPSVAVGLARCFAFVAAILLALSGVAPAQKRADTCDAEYIIGASTCDQKWENYKSGYKTCVYDAAKFFAKEYHCLPTSVEKLGYSCKDCERRFKK